MGEPDVWPLLLDMSRDDCKRILRRLELEAYSNLVSVLRAQGSLTAQKRRLLQNVAQTLSISEERHKAECRRAVNSEKLATIAKHMSGTNSGTEWAIEGRRLVPLLPRLVPQTAFTAIADKVANMAMTEGAKLPLPTPPLKKRMTSPPIDEFLLEPNVPEASKTSQVSSGSPTTVPNAEHSSDNQQGKPTLCSTLSPQFTPNSPSSLQDCSSAIFLSDPAPQPAPPSPHDPTFPSQVKEEVVIEQAPEPTVASAVLTNHTQRLIQASTQPAPAKSQVVLLVKKDDRPQEDRLSRKRPRSSSLDVTVNTPTSMMPPPFKKEIVSPISPLGVTSPLSQLPTAISPQTHSHLVQQQTLQAAAAAAAAASSSTPGPVPVTHEQQSQPQQTAQLSLQQVHAPPPLALPVHTTAAGTNQQPQPYQAQTVSQQIQNLASTLSQTNAHNPTPSTRTITIPSQGTVKLSLASSTPNSGAGIPSGTHKVIIVSSTTPSILQRSLSVPVVKSLSTSAPSQPCTSTLVLNTNQQTHQVISGSASSTGTTETTSSILSHQVTSSTLSSKVQGKLFAQSTPKTRPRANSIVIPVTPNQTNVMNSVGVTSVQLKSALQAGKQGVLKSSDAAGLKIMPISNMTNSSKLLPKSTGSGPMYVVSTQSTTSSSVSMVARTVPAGGRVMTISSSLPKVAVSTSQGGNVLSVTSKPMQTLQFSQAGSAVTSSGSVALSSSGGKPNVIVVQKGSGAFGRGVTLSHAGKEVVGKVLLGGKALTSLNQSQFQTTGNSAMPGSNLQPVSNQTTQLSTSLQTCQSPATTTATTRVVTVQKLPSAVVQGSTGSSNVIVLDLSQEQFNNSAVLNEILASSILQSSNVMSLNQDVISESGNSSVTSVKGILNLPNNQTDMNTGGQSSNGSAPQQSRGHTDICATAMSNANLNFNDLLDDNSMDGIQPVSYETMEMEMAPGSGNISESNIHGNTDGNDGNWDLSGTSQMTTDGSEYL
ncbi:BRCA2-interacting transcriptional repressor EMSY isoform X2 [Thrips palmi]|uniref:BRCA2-interacting transcriptional repressor EMSY isoform X2 n=1 Tax=Thrips palmi TaxID=161013 RepID=A0A6P8YK12_THRPL|nr:BRCA2-interacting transcriptional repressor EMSY isoform X2 [Thrips palmi]